jgi:exonuclease VII large subunit
MAALGTESAATPNDVIDRFHAEAAALRRTLDELDQAHRTAWGKECEEARKAIGALQADLAVAADEAQAEREATDDELRRAVNELVDAWRGRLDDLRVQERLAEMGARDTLERWRLDVQRTSAELRAAVMHAIDAVRGTSRS